MVDLGPGNHYRSARHPSLAGTIRFALAARSTDGRYSTFGRYLIHSHSKAVTVGRAVGQRGGRAVGTGRLDPAVGSRICYLIVTEVVALQRFPSG